MEISYEFSPISLRKGMKAHMRHRHPIARFILPSLGVIIILCGLHQVYFVNPSSNSLAVILFMLGAFYLFLSKRRVSTSVKNAFKANPNERLISLTVTDALLTFVDGESTATTPLSAFVDFKVCKDGLLIYPQKLIVQWIPDTAEIEGGTWEDFTALISSKIIRKL